MYLDERGYTVLKTIVNNPAITGKEVEASLQLSRKQLSYTIEKINDYLQDNGMPKIERLRTGKFIIPVAVIEQYQTEEITGDGTTYIYTDKERGLLIFLMLLCVREELSIYHFTSKLEISKNTFLTDLKKLEQRLEEYHLEVLYSRQEGYHLVGSEYAKREMMVTSIRGILKIPRGNPVEAAKVIAKNQTLQMDIGRAYDDKYFINIAAAGSFTELTYSVPSRLKTVLGYLAYLVKGAELLPQVKKVPVRITHDEGVFEGGLSMIFVALTNSVGGFETIAPDAKLDDGKFTLIMVKTANLFELVDLIRQVLQGGKHIYDKRISYIKTSSLYIEPLSDTTVKGSSSYEPVYVNSVTYGRMGILVFETDEDYIFAKKCISKEFSRIFQSGKEKMTKEEEQFFNETEFKLLVIGGDSNYTVHSINGYAEFLEMIYKSRFTEEAYGVPISCTFAYANSHEIVELEIENTIYIEPLFVSIDRAESRGYSDDKGLYSSSSSDIYLSFYRDREKTKKAFPKPDIEFRVTRCHRENHYYPDYNNWPAILIDSDDNEELVCLRNVDYKPMIYVGSDYYQYSQSGPAPLSPMQSIYQYQWEANEKSVSHTFHNSPFFRYI